MKICRASLIAAFAGTLSLLSISNDAAANDTQISLVRLVEGEFPQIEVNGEWFSGCAPVLESVTAQGNQITVLAATDSDQCSAAPGPYQLHAELPAASKSLAAGTVFRLRYELRDDPLNGPRLLAFELTNSELGNGKEPANALEVDPETGFWWGEPGGEFDHAGPGIGAQIERQGDILAVSFSGYADSGNPEWMFGATAFVGRRSDIALSRLAGGRGPFGGYLGPAEAASAGRLQIEWLTSARAVFWFSRPSTESGGIELQPISMVRFDFGQHPGLSWTGRWRFAATSNSKPFELEFVDIVQDDAGFTLIGKAGDTLSCESAADRPQSPPVACELERSNGRLARFDDVGLARLRGLDEDGQAIGAIQLSR